MWLIRARDLIAQGSAGRGVTACSAAGRGGGTRTTLSRTAGSAAGVAALAVLLLAAPAPAAAQERNDAGAAVAGGTVRGPARGALVVAGGGRLDEDITGRFIELAGGADARIVILPAAGTVDEFAEDWAGYAMFRAAGVRDVRVLHTRDRAAADSDAFVQPLREATGVWIPGGRQWRLVNSYLGTRTVAELHALLDRGGVIGGTSAGASIQASYMVRGAVEGNTIMMAPGYEEGFGFLRNTAVDQHLIARGREEDMLAVVARHPQLLGIGLDEGTAIVVQGDRAEVVGRSAAAFYNVADAGTQTWYFLRAGDVFDLRARRTLAGRPVSADGLRDEADVIAAMNRLFDAMRAQDTAAIRALAHPELRVYVPGGPADSPSLRVSTLTQFMESVARSAVLLDERAHDPEVRVDGNLASIWTYYDFFRGTDFSHCGYDGLHFARTAGGDWQIIGLAYTTRTTDCRGRP